jgi:hypothetical protein
LDGQFLQHISSGSKAKSLNSDCVGTLQLNGKDISQTVKEKKLEKGRLIAQHSSPVPILKWSDKKDMAMISTYHGDKTGRKVRKRAQEKSVSVLHCNKNMTGDDLEDHSFNPITWKKRK